MHACMPYMLHHTSAVRTGLNTQSRSHVLSWTQLCNGVLCGCSAQGAAASLKARASGGALSVPFARQLITHSKEALERVEVLSGHNTVGTVCLHVWACVAHVVCLCCCLSHRRFLRGTQVESCNHCVHLLLGVGPSWLKRLLSTSLCGMLAAGQSCC